jgi:hypothetical protein
MRQTGFAGMPFLSVLVVAGWTAVAAAPVGEQASWRWKPQIPRTRDESALADWATPVAGLDLRPSHLSAEEYAALPEELPARWRGGEPGRDVRPGKVEASHVPGGWVATGEEDASHPGPSVRAAARAAEREQLVAFLKTL